jgi:hypothetical protein
LALGGHANPPAPDPKLNPELLKIHAKSVKAENYTASANITQPQISEMIRLKLVTLEELKKVGLRK